MKKLFLNLCMAWVTFQASAEEIQWMTSAPEALKKAKQENKLVLLDFTGSDWCGWCMKLKREVFDTKDFTDYANTNLVLVEVDFPMRKEQSPDVKKANAALQKKYGVTGYPTLIILAPDGKHIGKMGYMPGGPQPFITRLNKFKAKSDTSG